MTNIFIHEFEGVCTPTKMYDRETLEGMSRKEIQKLCKDVKIKANRKNCELIEDLYNYFLDEEKAIKAMENSLRHCSKETSCNPDEPAHSCAEEIKMESTKHTIYELHGKEGGPSVEPVSSSGEQNKDHDDVIKEAIFKELEQRAAERVALAEKIPGKPNATGSRVPVKRSNKLIDFTAAHAKEFSKMDSIDVYFAKKRKRSDKSRDCILEEAKGAAASAHEALKKMKFSHNTPNADRTFPAHFAGGDEENSKSNNAKRLSFKSPAVRRTTLHIDTNVSFNFVSKLPSSPKEIHSGSRRHSQGLRSRQSVPAKVSGQLRTSPRLAVLGDKTNISMTENQASLAMKKSTPIGIRKSVHFTSNQNATIADLGSSFLKGAPPVKFDLQASLKKGLSYTPHKGKLQPFQDTTVVNNTVSSQPRLALKDMKAAELRERRRTENKAHKEAKKSSVISRRRGIPC